MPGLVKNIRQSLLAVLLAILCCPSFAFAHGAKHKHVHAHARHKHATENPLSDAEWAAIQQRFHRWLPQFEQRALAAGISRKTIDDALGHAEPIRTVVVLDRKQPESVMSFAEYSKKAVNPRVAQGRAMMAQYAAELRDVETQYGVPGEYVVALWGMETNYGDYQGGFNVPDALATLAVEGRRRDFFTAELIDALHLLDNGGFRASEMKGSWAGAMGNNQFMPSTLLRFGRDGDGDGLVNIWSRKHLHDTFASSANKLVHDGWRPGEIWGRQVMLPEKFPRKLISASATSSLTGWKKLGVKQANGEPLPVNEVATATLAAPGMSRPHYPGGPVFLAYNNYRTLERWNAGYFPGAVGLLADRIRQPATHLATQ